MAVFLSPGVFPREIDLSVLPTAIGPLRPGFIGTAKKGPLNVPTLITNSTQAIDTFGDPFPESYLMYAVLAYLEEGNAAFVMRVGVECEEGQPDELADICIDTSGGRASGWGRIPLFTGIDYGRINLREVGDGTGDNAEPLVFHAASTSAVTYNDVDLSTTDGPTSASGTIGGTYTGAIDDSWVMIITSPPDISDGAALVGAEFQIVRNSDGSIVAEGTLADSNGDGTSDAIGIGDGLSITVTVSSGRLDENDTFTWSAEPDNQDFSIAVDGDSSPTTYTMPSATYTTVADFVAAANGLLSGEDYIFVEYTMEDGETTIPQIRSTVAGERLQLMSTAAFALECGTEQYAWDIPRSFLLGLDPGPYNITTQNNRVKMNMIGENETTEVEFNVPVGLNQTTESIAAVIDAAGIVAGEVLWNSFALTAPGGLTYVVIETSVGRQLDTLQMLANYSNLRTLRFAEELNIPYPYKRAYRGFSDNRLILPDSGETTASTPLSCEVDPFSSECAADTAYFQSIVGWLVAPSAGTWLDGYSVNLELFTTGVGDAAGRYTLTILDSNGQPVDAIEDVSFDKREERYIANLVNPGTSLGGTNGNAWVNWEERPAFLENNVNDTATFVVRQPSALNGKEFQGMANGIPTDPAYSSELDAAVIGNPATSTGIYAFQNPESIDINLLATPGFSTGAVIGTALQMCESRGDVLYIVDPPFGLRPQQVVDWHNGMLLSDLKAAVNSSYGALYWGWLRVFDQFSADEIWIPPSGHVTAVFSRTAREAEQWFAPAGLRRGRLLTALDVEYSPTQGERDLLYGSGNAVNPIVKFPQDGITIWGQRTLQRTQSALDRVNVRMLLIFIKKNLIQLLRNFIFEPNDRILWRQVSATIEPFLADIQARRGLTAFRVIVDETNNTPERIDRNELWVSVFLKPTRTVEFIVLNLVVLRTGASFSAEEVLAAGGIVTAATAT
jgi:phage tail sheath protein FI